MKAVMDIGASLGFDPVDVSVQDKGYNIESEIPAGLRDAYGITLRFIVVKGPRVQLTRWLPRTRCLLR